MANTLTSLSDWACDASVDQEINAAITRLQEFFWEHQEAEDSDDMDYPESPSGYPFCSCETCQGREYAAVLFPVIAQATAEGRIWRVSSTAEDSAVNLLEKDERDRTTTDSQLDDDPDPGTGLATPDSGR
jgi:hypothetical protein